MGVDCLLNLYDLPTYVLNGVTYYCIEDAVFIDDVLSYLKYAEECGVTAYHISSFIE